MSNDLNDLTDVCNVKMELSYSATDEDSDQVFFKIESDEERKVIFKIEMGSTSETVIFYREDVHKLAEFFTKSLEAIGIAHSEKKK